MKKHKKKYYFIKNTAIETSNNCNPSGIFQSIKMNIKDCAVKLLILTLEINIEINIINELKKYEIIFYYLKKGYILAI